MVGSQIVFLDSLLAYVVAPEFDLAIGGSSVVNSIHAYRLRFSDPANPVPGPSPCGGGGEYCPASVSPLWLFRGRHPSYLRVLAPCVIGGGGVDVSGVCFGFVSSSFMFAPCWSFSYPPLESFRCSFPFFAFGFSSSWLPFFLFHLFPSASLFSGSHLSRSLPFCHCGHFVTSFPCSSWFFCGSSFQSFGSCSWSAPPCSLIGSFGCFLFVPCVLTFAFWPRCFFTFPPFLGTCPCCVFPSCSCRLFFFFFSLWLCFFSRYCHLLVLPTGHLLLGSFSLLPVGSCPFSGSSCRFIGSCCSSSSPLLLLF